MRYPQVECRGLKYTDAMTFPRRSKKEYTLVASIFSAVVVGGVYFSFPHTPVLTYETPQEADPYVRFMMEGYDSINENYWIKPGGFAQFNTPELSQMFQSAVLKEGFTTTLATSTRSGVAILLADALKSATSTEAMRQFATQTLTLVLYNLPPIGRDSLLSKQEEVALRQNVANVNPGNDLYQNLGLKKGATATEVNQAYEQKSTELKNATSTEAKAELQKVEYAQKVLTDTAQKELYDTAQIEPSVSSHLLGRTLYLGFNKISPTTLQEFAHAVDTAKTVPNLDSMILDMRGNVGGSLDFAPAFLGLFIGTNQYAFDLYHQGDNQVQRTTLQEFPELSRYKEIAVLTDTMTQSTAELTTAILKRSRIAHVIGTRTRGWGSVENTYSIKTSIDPATSYALLLVNSLTLRDDQQPIEQNGIIPDIDTNTSGWQKELPSYFTSTSLISALTNKTANAPLR